LEDDLHVPPNDEHLLAVVPQYVLAIDEDLALRRFQKAQDEAGERALAAPRLPASSENETPSTALTMPSWVLKCVLRLFIYFEHRHGLLLTLRVASLSPNRRVK
jgi:hypothetical protein